MDVVVNIIGVVMAFCVDVVYVVEVADVVDVVDGGVTSAVTTGVAASWASGVCVVRS